MSERLLIILIVLDLLLLLTIFRYARAGRLALRYAIGALGAAGVFTILIVVPSLLRWAVSITGVQSWLAGLLGAFVLIVIWLFLRLGVELSRLNDQVVVLSQELAMLRAGIEQPGAGPGVPPHGQDSYQPSDLPLDQLGASAPTPAHQRATDGDTDHEHPHPSADGGTVPHEDGRREGETA